MKITVCELPDEAARREGAWADLVRHLVASPTDIVVLPEMPTGGHRRWRMAACLVAIMSGCFVASANRRSYDSEAFAGRSWLISPEGEILAETGADSPFLTVEIDLAEANRAKRTYPRNLMIS